MFVASVSEEISVFVRVKGSSTLKVEASDLSET
jgi:hypothetical protein